MARCKPVDEGQMTLGPVRFAPQSLPGRFASARRYRIDHALDLSACEARVRHADVGAPASAPAVRRTLVWLADSPGMGSSRALEAAGREHVRCMALSGDRPPPCTTLAECLRTAGEALTQVFTQGLVVGDRPGVSGRERCAIAGVTRPRQASQATRGPRQAGAPEAATREPAVAKRLPRHRDHEAQACEPAPALCAPRPLERRSAEARTIRPWRTAPPEERRGPHGCVRQRQRPDHDSAKRATGTGVIQGSTGVAAVEARHQLIVAAQAHGVGQEPARRLPRREARQPPMAPERVRTADAGDPSAAHLAARARRRLDADMPDVGYRPRDPRVAAPPRHRDTPDPLDDKPPTPDQPRLFRAQACRPAADRSSGRGPAGTRLSRHGRHHHRNGCEAITCTGTQRDCGGCPPRRAAGGPLLGTRLSQARHRD